MDNGIPDEEIPRRIDFSLDYLLREWHALPDVEQDWPTLDEMEQLAFDVEWGIREDHLHTLGRWAEAGKLTPVQAARYAELQEVVRTNRPILVRLGSRRSVQPRA
jgi:hypothetical protein